MSDSASTRGHSLDWPSLLLVSVALCASGCRFHVQKPDEDRCSRAHPECPAGKSCQNDICISSDAAWAPDVGVMPDAARDARSGERSLLDAQRSDGNVATALYVDRSKGSDEASCTESKPCATIGRALKVAGNPTADAPRAIHVAFGTYAECSLDVPPNVILVGNVGNDETLRPVINLEGCCSATPLTVRSGATLRGFRFKLKCSSSPAPVRIAPLSGSAAAAVLELNVFEGTVAQHAIDIEAAVEIRSGNFYSASGFDLPYAAQIKAGSCYKVTFVDNRVELLAVEFHPSADLRKIWLDMSGTQCLIAAACVILHCNSEDELDWGNCCDCKVTQSNMPVPGAASSCLSPSTCSPPPSCP